jgi:hypothetical protein
MKTKGKVRSVRYSRLKNLGNYENERYEVEAVVGPNETTAQAAARVKNEVEKLLGLPTADRFVEQVKKGFESVLRNASRPEVR